MYTLIVVWFAVIGGELQVIDQQEIITGLNFKTCVAMSVELQKQVDGDGGTAGCWGEV